MNSKCYCYCYLLILYTASLLDPPQRSVVRSGHGKLHRVLFGKKRLSAPACNARPQEHLAGLCNKNQ